MDSRNFWGKERLMLNLEAQGNIEFLHNPNLKIKF